MSGQPLDAALLQAILGAIDEGIHVVNRQGITIFYNHAAASLDGLDATEVVGKHVLEVFPSLSYETSTLLKCVKTGQAFLNEEQTFTSYKGDRITTLNSTWPVVVDGERVGALEVSKDLTRIRELSERVVDLQAALGRRGRGNGGLKGRAASRAHQAVAGDRSAAVWTFDHIVGQSPRLVAVLEKARRAARTDSTVLVYGETGTGKELLVQAIHNGGPRAGGPFIAQNCAALPESLLEGILFGTARGGFTGAEDRPGLFELASGGSLFLDEVHALSPVLQAKLLRVLQERRVRRVGELGERSVDVRVLASANVDPLEAVAQGLLRQDLYYRINTVTLELPPLRERPEDVPVLTRHFLKKLAASLDRPGLTTDPSVDRLFLTYPWPGNIRELEHALEGAAGLAEGDVLRLEHLPAALRQFQPADVPPAAAGRGGAPTFPGAVGPAGARTLPEALTGHERALLEQALAESGGSVSGAARLLGIPRQTLQYKLKQYRLR
ncbi:MAG: sigma-54 interaction domain-containing protein [Bacillota bacterium]